MYLPLPNRPAGRGPGSSDTSGAWYGSLGPSTSSFLAVPSPEAVQCTAHETTFESRRKPSQVAQHTRRQPGARTIAAADRRQCAKKSN